MHIDVLFIAEEDCMDCKKELLEIIENIEREDIIAYIYYFIKKKFKVG